MVRRARLATQVPVLSLADGRAGAVGPPPPADDRPLPSQRWGCLAADRATTPTSRRRVRPGVVLPSTRPAALRGRSALALPSSYTRGRHRPTACRAGLTAVGQRCCPSRLQAWVTAPTPVVPETGRSWYV